MKDGKSRPPKCEDMNAIPARIEIEPYLAPSCSIPLGPYRQLTVSSRQRSDKRVLTTSLSGCCGSGPLLAFFAASLLESSPALGFAPLVPLRCSCPIVARIQPPGRPHERETRTVCFLLSAASRTALRGSRATLSLPPAPPSPRVCVVPTTLCPPSIIPSFEQSAPIRVGDRGKKFN